MSVIIFIIMLAVLVLVHELGHFLVAKKAGMRVDEFGLGFPPRIMTLWEKNGTKYTLNAIPFGGFVKIFGENPDESSISGSDKDRSFVNKPKYWQAAVLVAGVTFNFLFAWLLISLGFISGLPTPVDYAGGEVRDAKVVITNIAPNTPASVSGIKAGDSIKSLSSGTDVLVKIEPSEVSNFIASHSNEISFVVNRGKEIHTIKVTPVEGIVAGKKAIGISMDMIGILRLPIHKALWEGAKTTVNLTERTAVGLGQFLWSAVRGQANVSQVTGPVGIIGMVGDAEKLGFIYLLSFAAFISINLAVINLLPFPAIDGGRLIMVIIEVVSRKKIPSKVANTINAVGFILLLGLMVVVTIHDVIKLF